MMMPVAPFRARAALRSALSAAVRVSLVTLLPSLLMDQNLRRNELPKHVLRAMSAEAVAYLAAAIFFVLGLLGGWIALEGLTQAAQTAKLRLRGLHDQRHLGVRCNRRLCCVACGALLSAVSLLASLITLLRYATPATQFDTEAKRRFLADSMLFASLILMVDTAAVEFFSGGKERLTALLLNYLYSCELAHIEEPRSSQQEDLDEDTHAENIVTLMAKIDGDLRVATARSEANSEMDRSSVGVRTPMSKRERVVSTISSVTFASSEAAAEDAKAASPDFPSAASAQLDGDDQEAEDAAELHPSGAPFRTPDGPRGSPSPDREAFQSFANAIRYQSPSAEMEAKVGPPAADKGPHDAHPSVRVGPVQQLRKSGAWPNQTKKWKPVFLWASRVHIRLYRVRQDAR